jgi:3-oxoacyl-[acyl-carrier protein] reductase
MNLKKKIKGFIRLFVPDKKVIAQVSELGPNEYLKDRKALITGGTNGIGYAMAKAFVKAGAAVCITGRNQQRVDEAVRKLKEDTSKDAPIYGFQMDNREVSKFDCFLTEVISKLQGLDILVNNAGVLGGDIQNCSEDDFDKILDTNLKASFFLSRAVARHCIKQHIEGNILNIASSSSLRPASSAYTLSKWGLRGMTLGMAKSFAPYGITVNGLAPGPTATNMILGEDRSNIAFVKNPTGRCAMPEEIANMAVFLTSSMGKMIVGDTIFMTGGAGLITFDDVHYNFSLNE